MMELPVDNKIPFIGIEIVKNGTKLETQVYRLVRQSQIVQSVMQDCKYILSHLLPVLCRFCGVVGNLLVQGPKITYNYCLSRWF